MMDISFDEQLNDKLLSDITGLSYSQLDDMLLGDKSPKLKTDARELISGLCKLFDIRIKDATGLLGISESRLSRNKNIDRAMLDKTEALIAIYSKVAQVLGNQTTDWFKTENAALDGKIPLQVLDTRYGLSKIENMVDALLHGAYL